MSPRPASEAAEDGPSAYRRALVAELALLMERRVFRRRLQPLLSLRQRARLWALRHQALCGDAPGDAGAEREAPKGREGTAAGEKGEKGVEELRSPPPRPRRWYYFTERLYYDAWIGLRGTMSPHVAAETFCTEFFYLLKIFPVPAMLPVMESALNCARARAIEANAALQKKGIHTVPYESRPREEGMFCIRGCKGDPAVIAFVWLCRAHCIPCEVLFEPVAAAPGEHDVFLVRAPHVGIVLTDPLAAFLLCVEMYLPDSEHWMGILPQSLSKRNAHKSPSASHSSTSLDLTPHTQRAMERSMWIEFMKHIETDLRAPLLRYLCEAQRQEKCGEGKVSEQPLAKLVAGGSQAARNRKNVSRLSKLSWEAMVSLARFERFATHYYSARPAVSHCLISVAELCVAAYAFVLCTNPYCKALFPLLESTAPSPWATNGSHYASDSSIPTSFSTATTSTTTTAAATKTTIATGTQEPRTEETAQLHRVPPGLQATARRILNDQFLSARSSLTAVIGVVCGNHRLLPAREAAVDAVDALIRAKCAPSRERLAEMLARAWVAANEQCIGFPFLVLDGEQAPFLTVSVNAKAAENTIPRAPWSGRHGWSVGKVYLEKLRASFGLSTLPSYECRMYCNPASRL